jgi:hypothetical protein
MYRLNATQPGAMRAMLNYYRAALQLPAPPHVLGPNAKLRLPVRANIGNPLSTRLSITGT